MNNTFFISKMTGHWIVQSTYYSLLRHHKLTETFLNQVKWDYFHSSNIDINSLLANFNQGSILYKASLYSIKCIKNSLNQQMYCVLIYNKMSNKSFILKLNSEFNLTNKCIIKNIDQNYLHITSTMKNITVIEKIYFFHHNLKVTKSIIKKDNKCIGISFSSEIRIS